MTKLFENLWCGMCAGLTVAVLNWIVLGQPLGFNKFLMFFIMGFLCGLTDDLIESLTGRRS